MLHTLQPNGRVYNCCHSCPELVNTPPDLCTTVITTFSRSHTDNVAALINPQNIKLSLPKALWLCHATSSQFISIAVSCPCAHQCCPLSTSLGNKSLFLALLCKRQPTACAGDHQRCCCNAAKLLNNRTAASQQPDTKTPGYANQLSRCSTHYINHFCT